MGLFQSTPENDNTEFPDTPPHNVAEKHTYSQEVALFMSLNFKLNSRLNVFHFDNTPKTTARGANNPISLFCFEDGHEFAIGAIMKVHTSNQDDEQFKELFSLHSHQDVCLKQKGKRPHILNYLEREYRQKTKPQHNHNNEYYPPHCLSGQPTWISAQKIEQGKCFTFPFILKDCWVFACGGPLSEVQYIALKLQLVNYDYVQDIASSWPSSYGNLHAKIKCAILEFLCAISLPAQSNLVITQTLLPPSSATSSSWLPNDVTSIVIQHLIVLWEKDQILHRQKHQNNYYAYSRELSGLRECTLGDNYYYCLLSTYNSIELAYKRDFEKIYLHK